MSESKREAAKAAWSRLREKYDAWCWNTVSWIEANCWCYTGKQVSAIVAERDAQQSDTLHRALDAERGLLKKRDLQILSLETECSDLQSQVELAKEYVQQHWRPAEAKAGFPFCVRCGEGIKRGDDYKQKYKVVTILHDACKPRPEQPHVAFVESVLAEPYESPYPPVSVPNLEGESQ